MATLPTWFEAKLDAITAKRAKTVIDHIRKHGQITTEELKETYGYHHPPRAARDVRELGIGLETFSVRDALGRSISAYRFDPDQSGGGSGRKAFPKAFKDAVVARDRSKCGFCLGAFDGRKLQLDHRIPYEIAGDSKELRAEDFLCVCGSCNRAKSWTCEHCDNWLKNKEPDKCLSCYWGNPARYSHVALRDIRRLDAVWQGDEVPDFDSLAAEANAAGVPIPEFVKAALRARIAT